MSTTKKGSALDSTVKQEDVIQAVIIADSFNSRFAPITHRKPRVESISMNWKITRLVSEFRFCFR